MVWTVQNALAVVFTPPATTSADSLALWSKITGNTPDNFNRHPPGSTASGQFEGDELTIAAQPGRIDITIAPLGGDAVRPPVYSNYAPAIEKIKKLAQYVAREENPIRVAMVANCVKFMRSEADAVASFVESTHLPGLPAHAIDLNFSMNVRRKFGAAGWEMNRIIRWSTGKFQRFQFAMGGASMQVPQIQSELDLATMTIDVNSVARGSLPIGGTQAASAFNEFEAELIKLISGGYDALTDI